MSLLAIGFQVGVKIDGHCLPGLTWVLVGGSGDSGCPPRHQLDGNVGGAFTNTDKGLGFIVRV
jgi:hypothetical protein